MEKELSKCSDVKKKEKKKCLCFSINRIPLEGQIETDATGGPRAGTWMDASQGVDKDFAFYTFICPLNSESQL